MAYEIISENEKQNKLGRTVLALLFFATTTFFVPLFGIPLVILTFLLLSVSTPATKKLVKFAGILCACGIILYLSVVFMGIVVGRIPLLLVFSLFLPYVVAPLLIILAFIMQLLHKPAYGRVSILAIVPFMIIFSLVNIRTYVVKASPYIYMPPALTNENIDVYKRCIEFVRKHDDLKDLVFYFGGVVSQREISSEPNKQFEYLARIDREEETALISKELARIMCPRFERYDDFVFFYKGNNKYIPLTEKEVWHAWPSGHGIVYSLNGSDPNQSQDPKLKIYKPFVKIYDNWYFSRALLMNGCEKQYFLLEPVSKTLIDHSLNLDDIDLNKLHRLFDADNEIVGKKATSVVTEKGSIGLNK